MINNNAAYDHLFVGMYNVILIPVYLFGENQIKINFGKLVKLQLLYFKV